MSACETINYIGKSVKRVDAYEKATGRAKFVEDLQLQFRDLLHVKALRSPHPHARIVRIDASRPPAVVLTAIRDVALRRLAEHHPAAPDAGGGPR